MTYKEFIAGLPKRGWWLTPAGDIRHKRTGMCPIEYLATLRRTAKERAARVSYANKWHAASIALELSAAQTDTILGAADGSITRTEVTLRNKLLRHFGLRERENV